jgi:hypothetical protein
MLKQVAACLALGASVSAGAATLDLRHPYGELVDLPGATLYVYPDLTQRIDCAAGIEVSIRQRVISARLRRLPPGVPNLYCGRMEKAGLDAPAAGWWTGELEVADASGGVVEQLARAEWYVGRPDTRCGPDPHHGSASVIVYPKSASPHQFAERVRSDSPLWERLGRPIDVFAESWSSFAVLHYPVPENQYDLRAMLARTGEFNETSAGGSVCFATPPPDRFGRVLEYYHARLDTYFYTVDAEEAAKLDSGAVPGWARTGLGFDVLVMPGCPVGRKEQAAYRFWGKPGVGPSSHVFTVQRDECRIVHRSGAWLYESSPFWATPPDSRGACTNAAELPLHRLWRPWGESNHRFTTDLAVVEEMKGKGWVHEGVRMCVRG